MGWKALSWSLRKSPKMGAILSEVVECGARRAIIPHIPEMLRRQRIDGDVYIRSFDQNTASRLTNTFGDHQCWSVVTRIVTLEAIVINTVAWNFIRPRINVGIIVITVTPTEITSVAVSVSIETGCATKTSEPRTIEWYRRAFSQQGYHQGQ